MAIFNLSLSSLIFFIISNHPLLTTCDENGAPSPFSPTESRTTTFKPGIVAVVGILTTIFSITFLLLLYIKHCKQNNYVNTSRGYHPPTRRNSGIDRKVIESLPMFRFSSLRGQKNGLECAVCLNKFESEEVLRLLPKCKHAFHNECIDTWLDAHSTCPLCRYRVDPEDVLLIDTRALYQITPQGKATEYTNPRVSGRHSSAGERGNPLEIIAENPKEDLRGRISLDSWNSRRKTGNPNLSIGKEGHVTENQGKRSKASRKDGQLLVEKHRLEHRIIISGAEEEEEGRRRWSDVEAADLLYLRSEMIIGGGEKSGRGVINGRSVSEITGMSRYRSNNGGGKEEREREEERVVKRWLAWISQSQQQHHITAVQFANTSSAIVL